MKVRRIIDLSQPILENRYKNPAFPHSKKNICMTHEADGWRAEIITAATHVGTHVDAPIHKIKGGKSMEDFPLERFLGEALVVDLFYKEAGEEITREDLMHYETRIKEKDTILLCTGWAYKKKQGKLDEYIYNSPWLGRNACQFLIAKKVNAVGIDHFSIGGAKPENVDIPHELLLDADILIFEDLILPEELLEKERWFFMGLPLMLGDSSGSFTRAAAVDFCE